MENNTPTPKLIKTDELTVRLAIQCYMVHELGCDKCLKYSEFVQKTIDHFGLKPPVSLRVLVEDSQKSAANSQQPAAHSQQPTEKSR